MFFQSIKKIDEWIPKIAQQRLEYKSKIKNLNALKKFSGDPLGGQNDSGWNSFFEENELKKLINLDVNRTYQDKDLFQNTTIKEIMVNILFIWARENRDVSYKQGMNEILAVVLFSLHPFYFENTAKTNSSNVLEMIKTDQDKNYKNIYLYVHDQDELSCDLYYIYDAIMGKGIKELYDNGTTKNKDAAMGFKKFDLFVQQWTDEDSSAEKVINI